MSQQELSWGWITTIWLAHILSQGDHRKVTVREGVYEPLEPDAEGVLRSQIFPGLWLPADALWAGDLTAMLATLQRGLTSPEHAAYVANLRPQRIKR